MPVFEWGFIPLANLASGLHSTVSCLLNVVMTAICLLTLVILLALFLIDLKNAFNTVHHQWRRG